MKRVFSGIQPTGNVHLGNYIGALKNWVAMQESYACTYCVVDLHAITVPQDPAELRKNILFTGALCLALGIDPKRSVLFVQSDVPEHAELAWILNCHAYIGELKRMTQFKEKSAKNREGTSTVGLYAYPVLMAADIFLHKADAVPVGEDQQQHLELARDIGRRFNNLYGETFVIPEGIIPKAGARVMGLDDPTKKMSKSAATPRNYVALVDSPDTIRQKFKTAVTDSGKEVKYDEKEKAAVSNLLTILSSVTGKTVPALEAEYAGQGYAKFKADVAEAVIEHLRPVRESLEGWLSRPEDVDQVLKEGAARARETASRTLQQVKDHVGLSSAGIRRAAAAGGKS